MGWNTLALFVQGIDAKAAVHRLGPADATGEWVDAYQATSGSHPPELLYAGESGGWAQVWTPSLDLIMDFEADAEPALTVVLGSVTSVYGFAYFIDGDLQRQIIYNEGEIALEEGDPLPVETTMDFPSWGPDEEFIWAVIHAVTGTTFDESVRYQAFELH